MSDEPAADSSASDDPGASATIRTAHDHPDLVAAAIAPDNTPEIDTRTAEGHVVTTVTREDASGLASTVDDYLVNLDVADRTVERATDSSTQ